MKVVQLSSSDQIGGASVACRRLHLALRAQGVESTIAVKIGRHSCPGIVTIGSDDSWLACWREWRIRRLLARYAETRPWGTELFTNPDSARRFATRDLPACDLVHLHWVSEFLDWRSFFSVIDRPWVWTLHDMNSFTGGCHYSARCMRYELGCGKCPQLGSSRVRDLSRRNWRIKHAALARPNARRGLVVAPSAWLAKRARCSPIFDGFPLEVVPNGIDEKVWAPQEARTLRRKLGLDPDKITILFVSEVVANKRKGFLELAAALSCLPSGLNCQLISAGQGKELGNLSVPLKHFGSIREEPRMAEIYNAADLFVIPSLEDNLPNTVMEAMACGTPVLGYGAGGIAEMIVDGATGRLVPAGDHCALANAMAELVRNRDTLRDLGEQARDRVLARYTADLQARTLRSIYERLVGAGQSAMVL
ncbi:MAG: glycosyltransferase family 4 protein [Opitutaceae bacterium]